LKYGFSPVVVAVLMALVASGALAAPQTFNTALPVAEGQLVFREQGFYKSATDDPSPANREVDVFGLVSVLGYGVSGKLALFAALPVLDKELDVTTPGGMRVNRGTSGVGDARLFGRYTFYVDNAPGRTFRIASFAGIEIPTGADRDTDSLGLLPATLQLGSGSWDPFFGIVSTYQTLDFEVDVQAGYKVNNSANGFEFGDEARFDASLQYRVWPRELTRDTSGFIYGVIEANLVHRARNEIGGIPVANSGGTSLYLAPGLQYVTRRWIAEAIVQLPVVQNLNGTALKDDYAVRAGFRVNF
jgi:outer membrane putative beta-barrel porin/alpha-amylase